MAKVKLTTRFIDALKVENRTDYFDTHVRGLSLRVSKTGLKVWNLFYTRESDGLKQRVKLGRYPDLDLDSARGRALKAMSGVADGNDPAKEKRARRAAVTLKELGELYIEKYAKPRKKTWREDERILKKEVFPEIGRMKADAVTRRDILDIIDGKAEAGYGAQSNNILAVIRKLFNWAVDGDFLKASPAHGIKPRSKAVRRDRVISDEEIAAIWRALPKAAISDETRDIIRLLFLTGQRSGEVCGMMRSEVDLKKLVWTIPAERTKNGLAHVVPLSGAVTEILTLAINATDPEDDDVPLFQKIGAPIQSNAIAQAVRLKLQISKVRWTPHDIRRTGATGMAGIGTAPHIVEAILNHVSGFKAGVAGVYNRAAYEPEKRQALDKWARHLEGIVRGSITNAVAISGEGPSNGK
jgi:integrase